MTRKDFSCGPLLALALSMAGLFVVAAVAGADIPGTVAPINFPAYADRMTLGPDGNIWLLDHRQNLVGRLTASGAFTGFPIPTPNSYPDSITAGSDGNLWFTEVAAKKIGRITPAGALTEFPVPANPLDIVEGPDGNRWFNDSMGRIVRIKPDGSLTPFSVAPSAPFHLGSGWGYLWFVDYNANKIGRVTTSGAVTLFSFPSSNIGIYGLFWVAGLDGNMWVTHGNNIARVTPAGVVTEYPVPTGGADPSGLTVGGDGNIWFTEYSAGKIGQLLVPTAADSGQATINEQSIGPSPGTIFQLPPQASGTAAGVARPEAVASCPPPVLVIQQYLEQASANLASFNRSAPSKCADLAVGQEDIECDYHLGRESSVLCSVTVHNNGPDTAEMVVIRVGVPGDVSFYLIRSLEARGKTTTGFRVPEDLNLSDFLVSAEVASATPDPDLRNNSVVRALQGSLINGVPVITNLPAPPADPPGKRGQ